MVSKIRSVISDENFGEYVWAAVPIIAIILGAFAFLAISLVKAG